MSQSPKNSPPQKPASQQPSPTVKTTWGKRTEKTLENIFEPLDLIGGRIMGELWRTLYLTVQDAIALSFILQIPSAIGQWVLGKDFSEFDVCLQENALSPNRYACFVIVSSNFLLWIVLAGRILGRFLADISGLRKTKGGSNSGSGQP